MVDDDMSELSVDDILEAERAGRLSIALGDNPLPEDNELPITNEPYHGEEDESRAI